MASVVTPNIFEASQLSGIKTIETVDDMKQAAVIIKELGAKSVVIKGGKGIEGSVATDVVYDGENFEVLEAPKIETTYTHGAGCTFSAAIAAQLANGATTIDAIRAAKKFITQAIQNSFRLNEFVGTLNHFLCEC